MTNKQAETTPNSQPAPVRELEIDKLNSLKIELRTLVRKRQEHIDNIRNLEVDIKRLAKDLAEAEGLKVYPSLERTLIRFR